MATEKILSAEQQKRSFAEKMWLSYFNQYLFENNMLSEAERNRMISKIESRKSTKSKNSF